MNNIIISVPTFANLICMFLANVAAVIHFTSISREILQNCPHVSSEPYAPLCPYGETKLAGINASVCSETLVWVNLYLETFHGIDDIEQTFTFSGWYNLFWDVPCDNYNLSSTRIIRIDEAAFWKPTIHHKNALSDYGLREGFETRFYVEGSAETEGDLQFYMERAGIFSSKCPMDFSKYPFDVQQLEMKWIIRELNVAVRFYPSLNLYSWDSEFESLTGHDWTYEDFNVTVKDDTDYPNNNSLMTFVFTMRRKPEFHIYNMMLPTCILSSLQLAALLLPPDVPDRPAFSMSVMMSLTFIEGLLLDRIPTKPQRIFLATYTEMFSLLSLLCTIYTLFSCNLLDSAPKKKWLSETATCSKASPCCHLRRIRIIDILAFVVALAAFVGINCYALVVAREANYF